MTEVLLAIRGLTKHYPIRGLKEPLVALDGVDLDIPAGQTTAIVGESGSGKSTLARCLLGLVEPTGGVMTLDGQSLWAQRGRKVSRTYRDIQMVFQDPNLSLNPRKTVGEAVAEPLALHMRMPRNARTARVHELFDLVGLQAAHITRLPRELSGGQRQRVGIARALAVEPRLIVLDEPTSSLDVSVRGHVLDLLLSIQRQLGTTYLFISHDLEAVEYLADYVVVMYLGSVVEEGPPEVVLDFPKHPYTRALISAAPSREYGATKERFVLAGEIPSPIGLREECRLVGRCPMATPHCRTSTPQLVVVGERHKSACPVTASEALKRAAV